MPLLLTYYTTEVHDGGITECILSTIYFPYKNSHWIKIKVSGGNSFQNFLFMKVDELRLVYKILFCRNKNVVVAANIASS
jgi:hypothetical protein